MFNLFIFDFVLFRRITNEYCIYYIHDYRLHLTCMSFLKGILFANGESWKELRRFALTTLRDFGMGKRVAEQKILEECHHLIQMFAKHEGMEVTK